MGNEGPTNTATITAKIKGDPSDIFRTYEEVTAGAESLRKVNPEIKVKTTGAADALSKLAAVKAAQEALGESTRRLATAQSILEIEEGREGKKAALILPARLEAKAATDAVTRATEQLAVAEAALAEAEGEETAASVAANEANKTKVSRMALIASAVAALIPLLAPLAAYTVAVAGGFAAMGAAGILAVIGIAREIKNGTTVGNTYSAGLRALQGDLQSLSQTAAVAMLNDFQLAVGQINQAMPFLTTSTRVFTDVLGNAGNRALSGVISALHVLNPLFVQGAVYVDQLAAGFQKWTQDGGLEQFATYAQGALPRVADALGAIAMALLHIIEATAPMGAVVLGALTAISNVISGMPNDFILLAAAVTGGFLAFKAWGLIAPILSSVATAVGAVGVATEIATGPIGWIVAGITALAAVLAVITTSANTGATAVSNYTAAVQADTGAIAANVKAAAAKALLDDGAFAAAEKLHISTKLVTDAVLGNKDAIRELNAEMVVGEAGSDRLKRQMADTGLNVYDLSTAFIDLKKDVQDQSDGVTGAVAQYRQLSEATSDSTVSIQAQINAITSLSSRYGASVTDYQNADAAQQQAADQLAATTLQMRLQNDASGLLANALTILNGGSLSVAQAQTGLASANNALIDSIIANGSAVDDNSKAAVANQQAIQAQVQAAQQAAEAIGQQTGSSEKAVQSYMDSKVAIETQLQSQGLLTDAMQAYIDKLYDISNLHVEPTQIDVDAAAAQASLDRLNATLNGIDGRTVGFTVLGNGDVLYNDAQNEHNLPGHAGGGTVSGAGTGTSDSVVRRLSTGEEIIKTASASQPGVRPFLKAINAGGAAAVASIVGAGAGGGITSLSTEDRYLLRKLADRMSVISIDNQVFTNATRQGSAEQAALGAH